jgi:hypothetical protein
MRNLLGQLARILRALRVGAVDQTIEHGAGVTEIGQ